MYVASSLSTAIRRLLSLHLFASSRHCSALDSVPIASPKMPIQWVPMPCQSSPPGRLSFPSTSCCLLAAGGPSFWPSPLTTLLPLRLLTRRHHHRRSSADLTDWEVWLPFQLLTLSRLPCSPFLRRLLDPPSQPFSRSLRTLTRTLVGSFATCVPRTSPLGPEPPVASPCSCGTCVSPSPPRCFHPSLGRVLLGPRDRKSVV